MNNKATQKLIICSCMAIAISLYNYLPTTVTPEALDEVESANTIDFDLLGTKIFAPKKPTKLSDQQALEHYLTQQN